MLPPHIKGPGDVCFGKPAEFVLSNMRSDVIFKRIVQVSSSAEIACTFLPLVATSNRIHFAYLCFQRTSSVAAELLI
jgi:hypothetical protein